MPSRTEADRRSDSRYPSNAALVTLMAKHQSFGKVAAEVGVARGSLRDFLAVRPALRAQMDAHRRPRLSPEQRVENNRRSHRETARRTRAADPNEARRVRREQMARYGPDYRHRWNHYNRLRRMQLDQPDALAAEYVEVLRGDPCCYCGAPMQEIDHIEPLARGGDGGWENLTAACVSCNRRKNARPVLMFLLAQLPGAA